MIAGLQEQLDEAIKGSLLEIRRVRNRPLAPMALERLSVHESLDELNELEVFNRCLNARQVPDEQRPLLLESYREVLQSLHEDEISLQ